MAKWIKWFLILLLGLIILFALAIAIFVSTFNPNTYKSKLESYVLNNYSRELLIDGDIGLSFFPNLALQISKVSLSEPGSADKFAAVDDARLSVAMWPLLSKQVEIDHISVSGLDATIIKSKKGGFNFDDLLGKSADQSSESEKESTTKSADSSKSDLVINVAGIEVVDSQINYLDKGDGLNLNIYKIQANTGAINLNAPFPIKFQALVNSNQPQLALNVDFSSQVSLTNNYKDIALSGLDLKFSGDLADLKQLKTNLQADINLTAGDVLVNNLQFKLNGDLAGEKPLSDINLELLNGQIKIYPNNAGITGDLAINQAIYKDEIRDIKIDDVGAKIRSDDNDLVISDITANLYEGNLSGQFSSNNKQQINLKLDLRQIALQALLKSLSAKDLLSGRGFVQMDVNATGRDVKSIEKSLSGQLAMQVQEGAVLGVNARQALVDVSDLVGNLSNIKQLNLAKVKSPFGASEQTSFSKFDLLLKLKNGQGTISNLLIKSDLFEVSQGDPAQLNIPEQSLNVLLNTKIADDLPKSSKLENILGITIPIYINGSWESPQYSVKLDSLLRDQAVKSVIESGLGKLLGNDKKTKKASEGSDQKSSKDEAIGKALKGLFGG